MEKCKTLLKLISLKFISSFNNFKFTSFFFKSLLSYIKRLPINYVIVLFIYIIKLT